MKEKIIENWLINTSERGFQAGFCQLLSSQGYEILHSTTHNPFEVGKDIVAVSPDGTVCVYQLKVYDSKEISQAIFRTHIQQLFIMAATSIDFPNYKGATRKNYFVTNTRVHEGARHELRQTNETLEDSGSSPITIISGDKVMRWIMDTEANLWPNELREHSALLELFLGDGTQMLPIELMDVLLLDLFFLRNNENSSSLSKNEFKRRLASGVLLVFIALDKYITAKNHVASISAWTMFLAYATAACLKNNIDTKELDRYFQMVNISLLSSFESMLVEAKEKEAYYSQKYSDCLVKNSYNLLILSFLAIYWHMADFGKKLTADDNEFILHESKNFSFDTIYLCEASVIQYLPIHWYLKRADSSYQSDKTLSDMIDEICLIINKPFLNFAPPYFSVEDVLAQGNQEIFGISNVNRNTQGSNSRSYIVEPLFLLLVRSGNKKLCTELWPEYSKILAMQYETDKYWQNYVFRSPPGLLRVKQHARKNSWNQLVNEANDAASERIPNLLTKFPHIIMLWLLVAPNRATNEMVCELDKIIGS